MERSASMEGCVANPTRPENLPMDIDRSSMSPVGAYVYEPDRDAIFALVEGDMELFGELVELFLDNYPTLLVEIRDGINEDDPSRVREAAHSLKGSVGNFLADNAVELSRILEQMGRDGDLRFASQKLTELEMEMRLIHAALMSLRAEVGA
jgi:HPt (histidine-containing phosphotransfer) domain-containing protein